MPGTTPPTAPRTAPRSSCGRKILAREHRRNHRLPGAAAYSRQPLARN
jgi:hypothetical protein